MILNKATFSKVHGVSRAAITLAVNSGALVADVSGMIDDENSVNAAWVARRQAKAEKAQSPVKVKTKAQEKKPQEKKQTAKKIAQVKKIETIPEVEPDIDELPDDDDDNDYAEDKHLAITKLKADIRFKHEQADTALQKRLERLGQLIERDMVTKLFGNLGAEIKLRLLEMPARITPRLISLVKSGSNEKEIQAFFESEMSEAVKEIKKQTEILMTEGDIGTVK